MNLSDVFLNKVQPYICKKVTRMKTPISHEERLTMTLRYLATERSLTDLQFTTAISRQSLGKIIPETCKAIISSGSKRLHEVISDRTIADIILNLLIHKISENIY